MKKRVTITVVYEDRHDQEATESDWRNAVEDSVHNWDRHLGRPIVDIESVEVDGPVDNATP